MKSLEERIAERKQRVEAAKADVARSDAAINALQDAALREQEAKNAEAGVDTPPATVKETKKKATAKADPFAKKK